MLSTLCTVILLDRTVQNIYILLLFLLNNKIMSKLLQIHCQKCHQLFVNKRCIACYITGMKASIPCLNWQNLPSYLPISIVRYNVDEKLKKSGNTLEHKGGNNHP